jgi:hypothetical protein
MENQSYTCPNPSCGRAFTSPVKTENLCSKDAKVYDACPFCLTEISVEKDSITIEEKEHLKKTESDQASMYSREKKPAKPSPKVQGCTHHFGYLSKRSKSEKIPEECMMCEHIVQCMLLNVTG